MRMTLRMLMVSVVGLVVSWGPLNAQCNSPELTWQPIFFGAQAAPIIVPPSMEGASVVSPPLHGELTHDSAGRPLYTPNSSFWTVGTDRLTLLGTGPSPQRHIVQLLAPTRREDEERESAEAPPASGEPWQLEDPSSAASFDAAAALGGERGFWIMDSPLVDAFLKFQLEERVFGYGDAGTGAQGGWKPPGSGGGGGHCPSPPCLWPQSEALILTLGAPGEPYVGVRARTTTSARVEIRLESSGAPLSSWLPVSLVPHHIQLLAWDRDMAPSLAALFVDGELVATATLSFLMSDLQTQEVRFGSQDADPDMPAHGWDELVVFSLPEDGRRALCLREDGFDGDALSGQWQSYGSNYLDIEGATQRALGVLSIDPAGEGSPAGGLVIANNLLAETIGRLGLRFALDTASLTLPVGSTVLLVDAANNQSSRSFRLLLDGTATGPRLRVMATHLNNQSIPAATVSFPLPSDGSFNVELDWQRSTTDRVGTGYLRLFVDGEEKAELIGLHNHSQSLMDVRTGGITVLGNPSGKLTLDNLELWYEP